MVRAPRSARDLLRHREPSWRAAAVGLAQQAALADPALPDDQRAARMPGAGSAHGAQQMVELCLAADHDRGRPQACPTPHRPSMANYDQWFHGCAALAATASFQVQMRLTAPTKGDRCRSKTS